MHGDPAPEDLLVTERLHSRLARAGDLRAELQAFRELSSLAAGDPAKAIQRFLELAIELCPSAGSSGVSELEVDSEGEALFRWTALAGEFAPYVGGTTPRDFSPCGMCLDQGRTILVERPARVFTYFNQAHVPIIEGLVVPLGGTNPIGTIWVTSHASDVRGFDRTDAQVMEHLAAQLLLTLKLSRLERTLGEQGYEEGARPASAPL
jgi:GAF domain-containing protein